MAQVTYVGKHRRASRRQRKEQTAQAAEMAQRLADSLRVATFHTDHRGRAIAHEPVVR